MNPLKTIKGTIGAGVALAIVIALLVMVLQPRPAGVSAVNTQSLIAWLHVLAGITWIGLLYYFNFVQVPALAAAASDQGGPGGAGIGKYVAPRALLWFRWGAVVTWLTGAASRARGLFVRPSRSPPSSSAWGLARHDHAVQRLGVHLAEPKEGARLGGSHRRPDRQGTARGVPGVKNQHRCRSQCSEMVSRRGGFQRNQFKQDPQARTSGSRFNHPQTMPPPPLPNDIATVVSRAIAEDLGSGDLTAALIDARTPGTARVLAREAATLCGIAWFDETFRQIDSGVTVTWRAQDGERIAADTIVCELRGPARGIVTGERTALNFLQTLSGTATATRACVDLLAGTRTRVLDTRKTLPGLRLAQKYAVRCGGGENHRLGLFDAVLIKENHIAAVGSLTEAVRVARRNSPSVMIEVEVETVAQLAEALDTDADRIMLDNFTLDAMRQAVQLRDMHAGRRQELEASGSVNADTLRAVAATGVDFISIGAITKHLRAVDFSMRFI
jgi:nicotinate-nucleotide pyrophosphorylase (carboxylating)